MIPILQDYPRDWRAPLVFRAMVLMTDGQNCCFNEGYFWNRFDTREDQDASTFAVCDALRAEGVEI